MDDIKAVELREFTNTRRVIRVYIIYLKLD